jgi:diadenosine tetraphosphate (Ap4A) HIT family hydrolase
MDATLGVVSAVDGEHARAVTHADLDTLAACAFFPRRVARGHRVAFAPSATRVVVNIFSLCARRFARAPMRPSRCVAPE